LYNLTYRKSSGLEAIIGYLYLEKEDARLVALLEQIVQICTICSNSATKRASSFSKYK
jgi:23S rRNA maturation mini-RNase III